MIQSHHQKPLSFLLATQQSPTCREAIVSCVWRPLVGSCVRCLIHPPFGRCPVSPRRGKNNKLGHQRRTSHISSLAPSIMVPLPRMRHSIAHQSRPTGNGSPSNSYARGRVLVTGSPRNKLTTTATPGDWACTSPSLEMRCDCSSRVQPYPAPSNVAFATSLRPCQKRHGVNKARPAQSLTAIEATGLRRRHFVPAPPAMADASASGNVACPFLGAPGSDFVMGKKGHRRCCQRGMLRLIAADKQTGQDQEQPGRRSVTATANLYQKEMRERRSTRT